MEHRVEREATADELATGIEAATLEEFVAKRVDIRVIKDADPVFDFTPATNELGILMLQGKYTVSQGTLEFRAEYAEEEEGWKILKIHVNAN